MPPCVFWRSKLRLLLDTSRNSAPPVLDISCPATDNLEPCLPAVRRVSFLRTVRPSYHHFSGIALVCC